MEPLQVIEMFKMINEKLEIIDSKIDKLSRETEEEMKKLEIIEIPRLIN